jgi:hypothetical protein
MTDTEQKAAKTKPPKGGRKGGTLFPKIDLPQALEYSKKLVGKTHTGAQAAKTVLPGVFGSSTGPGRVRASALKQYGLMKGESDAYEASELAKQIGAAPQEDQGPLLRRAFLQPKVFKDIYDTFHGDSVGKPKIRQQALALKVHPESADECVEIFVQSAIAAGLGRLEGELVSLAAGVAAATPPEAGNETATEGESVSAHGAETEPPATPAAPDEAAYSPRPTTGAKPGFSVTLNVDSSSDPDKLQKQLELLRRYGLI